MARSGRAVRITEEAEALFLRADALMEQGQAAAGVKLLKTAAAMGHSGAQLNLGYCFDTGTGIRRSREQALYWWRKGARRKEGAAAANIGTLYRDEGKWKTALRWFEQAVSWGDDDSLLELARLYLGPLNNPQQARQALRTLRARKRRTTVDAQEQGAVLWRQLTARR